MGQVHVRDHLGVDLDFPGRRVEGIILRVRDLGTEGNARLGKIDLLEPSLLEPLNIGQGALLQDDVHPLLICLVIVIGEAQAIGQVGGEIHWCS
ncbi:hypothetical protein ES703_104329 [subsurface metagenome]